MHITNLDVAASDENIDFVFDVKQEESSACRAVAADQQIQDQMSSGALT